MAAKENNGAAAGGLVPVELVLAVLKENVDGGAIVSESLLAPPKENVGAGSGVEVAAVNANIDFAGVEPFPKKFNEGLEGSADATPN